MPGRDAAPRPTAPPAVRHEELIATDEELVAGRRPVEESFASRREARRLLVVPERRAALDALVLHATALRIPVVEVEGGTLTSLTGFDGHQGVALVVAARAPATLDDVLARARERGEPAFVLVLDSLEDPQNLGTLLRSAEACGVHGVIFPTRRSAPLSPAAIKASAGATEHLLLLPVDDLPAAMADLRARGLRLVGADEGAALRYGEADLRGPLALVVGSEERGISGALRRRLDLLVRIPMHGRVASLNAAVAGSVLLFAAAGQRGLPEAGDDESSAAGRPAATDSSQPPAREPRKRRTPRAVPPVSEQAAADDAADLLPGEAEKGAEGDAEQA
jgi:23S rRNA (guanosine2251-2'-O)-methyltransferase